MKTSLSILPLSVIGAACLSLPARSQFTEIPRTPNSRDAAKAALLVRYDRNKDGKLGKDEIAAIARDRMLAYDTNKDGKVDAVELKEMREKSRKMPKMTPGDRALARERDKLVVQTQEAERKAAENKTGGASAPEGNED